MYVAWLVAGKPIDMLVDTGSAVTLVHQRVLNRSPQNFKLSVVGEPVVSANGQPLDIRGKCDLEICVDGVNVVHSVLVPADVTQDCLLGIDFLGNHGCKIAAGEGTERTTFFSAAVPFPRSRASYFK